MKSLLEKHSADNAASPLAKSHCSVQRSRLLWKGVLTAAGLQIQSGLFGDINDLLCVPFYKYSQLGLLIGVVLTGEKGSVITAPLWEKYRRIWKLLINCIYLGIKHCSSKSDCRQYWVMRGSAFLSLICSPLERDHNVMNNPFHNKPLPCTSQLSTVSCNKAPGFCGVVYMALV